MAIDPLVPNTLYGGSDYHGVFKSTDGGMRWHEINSGLPIPLRIGRLAVDPREPSTVYAGTGGSGVFKSTDAGASWTAVNTGLPKTTFYVDKTEYVYGTGPTIAVFDLALDPKNPNIVYVSIYGSGVFKSINGGASWSAINIGLNPQIFDFKEIKDEPDYVTAIAIDPQNPSTVYAGAVRSGVFKSTNGGASWSDTGVSFEDRKSGRRGVHALVIDPQVPGTLYVATYVSGVFKSTNGGVSWVAVNKGLPGSGNSYWNTNTLAIDPKVSRTVYVGTNRGVFMSMNGGASWADVSSGLPVSSSIYSSLVYGVGFITIDPQVTNTIYAGLTTFASVYKSTNAGAR